MKISSDRLEEVFEAIRDIVGARDCLRAMKPSEDLLEDGEDYHEEVEITISSPDGGGSFSIPIPGKEVAVLYEAIFEIECSMRYNLVRSAGIDIA